MKPGKKFSEIVLIENSNKYMSVAILLIINLIFTNIFNFHEQHTDGLSNEQHRALDLFRS